MFKCWYFENVKENDKIFAFRVVSQAIKKKLYSQSFDANADPVCDSRGRGCSDRQRAARLAAGPAPCRATPGTQCRTGRPARPPGTCSSSLSYQPCFTERLLTARGLEELTAYEYATDKAIWTLTPWQPKLCFDKVCHIARDTGD